MSAEERQGLTQDLKDMQFIIDNVFFKMWRIRTILACAPVLGSLR
jgi:hypothetical protein